MDGDADAFTTRLESLQQSVEYYAVTGFGETIDEAAKKATRYMIDHLERVRGMDRYDAYALVSLAGDLKIAEVVDVPSSTPDTPSTLQ